MKKLILIFAAVAMYFEPGLEAIASPHFVTPEMTIRNGLTDAQYEALWKVGRHPRIDQRTARDWIFRSSRYENVTNWLGVIGKTNDFARLVVPTMATNDLLRAENGMLRSEIRRDEWRIEYLTNYVDRLETEIAEKADRIRALERESSCLGQQMTNGVYAIEKTDRFYKEREESAPDEKLRTIYREMREYLGIIRREFETPPNAKGESK